MNPLIAPTNISPESWEAFIEVRRRKGQRAPLTDYAVKLITKKLIEAEQQGYDPQFMMDEAIEKGWTSVYVTASTPTASRAADVTRRMLDQQTQTAEERERANQARIRVMAALRPMRRVA